MKVFAYKNNEYYEFLNLNPKGRNANDCVFRALSGLLDQSWETTVRELTELAIKKALSPNEKRCFAEYLKIKGYTQFKEPRTFQNKKITVRQFLTENPGVTCFAAVGSQHVTFIQNGKVRDSWDSSKKIMHAYWRKV